jgi:ABC-type Fe3+/spermidine/putrescine transport system ATPase subunit
MLEIRELHKDYEGQPLLRGITFSVRARETVCLLGPSGSGKSTLLRLIAGLEAPEGGQILWDGHDLASAPPHLRDFGLVFQDYALFPHLDVFDNVAFGLRMRGRPQSEIAGRVSDVLGIVNLEDFEHRAVTDLSGGEQQRVALARALAPRPRLLMFDEPLGALDRALREDLLDQLRTILHQTRIPAIYVTHDQEEAFTIADRVLLLHEGSIVRAGTPADVWAQPGSAWAAEFLGLGNVVPARVLTGGSKVDTRYGVFAFKSSHKHRAGDEVCVLLRPADSKRSGVVRGIVRDTLFRQDGFRIVLQGGLHFDLPRAARIGSKVTIPVEVDCLGPHAGPTVEGDG